MNYECEHGHIRRYCSLCPVEKLISELDKEKDRDLFEILSDYRQILIGNQERVKRFRHLKRFLGNSDLKKYVISSLRSMADELENEPMLGIYFAELPKKEPPAKGNTMDYIEVSISYPWGG